MRTVHCPGVGAVSALGFGCASLGSRISAKSGGGAIDAALRLGITWYDVAPSYGDGNAEALLGKALKGAQVAIVTKVGLTVGQTNSLKRLVNGIARPIVATIPALRPFVKRVRPDGSRRLPLEAGILRASLMRSLERLCRTEVAVLALHEPLLEDVQNESVIRALDEIKSQGLATRIALAGTAEIFTAARAAGLPVDTLQTAHSPFADGLAAAPVEVFKVTHSVFGVGGALERLKRVPVSQLKAAGFDDAPSALLAYAFASNPKGVVLTSSFASAHLKTNANAANLIPDHSVVARLDSMLKSV